MHKKAYVKTVNKNELIFSKLGYIMAQRKMLNGEQSGSS